MLSLRQDTRRYTASITNISKNTDLSDCVEEIVIKTPTIDSISSFVVEFKLQEKMIDSGNEVRIQVLDEESNVIYTLQGQAHLDRTQYKGITQLYSYTVKDTFDKLFDRVISKTETFYDLFICNGKDTSNSLIHIMASKLGVEVAGEDDLQRIPFVVFKEGTRWLDELQTLIAGTGNIIYLQDKKLFYKPVDYNYETEFEFDAKNMLKTIEIEHIETYKNSAKVVYDRFEKLDNQVVFNVAAKVITDANTNKDTQVPTMKIKYVSDIVANPTITKATGYYFENEDVKSKVEVQLKPDEHYILQKMDNTGCEVKFYNPYNYKMYIDNFEISGIPLVRYENNEVIYKNTAVLQDEQCNYIVANKNKYIQALEQAKSIAKKLYLKSIASNRIFTFNTDFNANVQLGKIYALSVKDINTKVRVTSFVINLQPSDFNMQITAEEVKEDIPFKVTTADSLNAQTQFIDLKPIHQAIDKNAKQIQETNKSLQLANNATNKVITQLKQELTQGIQDSKVKVYTLKPPLNALTDANIGDIYAANGNVEVLVKRGNKLTWERIADKQVEETLNNYMRETNNKMIAISYQSKAPTKSNEGDIWIDTANDGVWYRWNGKEWQQVDKSVREALKKANTDINKIEKSITTINNTINNKIMAKAFVQEQEPSAGMKNYDVWYKKSNNTYKVYLNGKWNNASEDDIFPALRHYASLSNAQLEIGTKLGQVDNFAKVVNSKADNINDTAKNAQTKADEAYKRAGIFLTNSDQKFGAKNGTLAEVSLDKEGAIRLSNANNLLEWNVKDPRNSKRMRSKFYMGVSDISKIPDDVYFKVGDEATGFTIELKEGKSIAKVDGTEISQKFNQVETNLKSSLETLKKETAQHTKTLENTVNTKTSEVLNVANSKINSLESTVNSKTKSLENNIGGVKQEIKGVTTTLTKDIDSKVSNVTNTLTKDINTKVGSVTTTLTKDINTKVSNVTTTLTKDIDSKVSGVNSKIDTKTKELTGHIDTQIANVSKTVESKVNGVKQEMSKELTDYTNKLKTQIVENIARLESADSKIAGELKKETEKILTEQRKSTEDYKRTLDDILNRTYYLSLLPHAKMLYPDPEFASGRNSTDTYEWGNNGGMITSSIIDYQSPNSSGKVLQIVKKQGKLNAAGCGGFQFGTPCKYRSVYVSKIIAKIPKGFTLQFGSNSIGDNGNHIGWLGEHVGTGEFETYYYALRCGTTNFSSTNYYYLGCDDTTTAVTWYVAYATVFDCTADDDRIATMKRSIQNYKTEFTANIGTVEKALKEGNFVVTGNTVFDGNASFISKGTDEKITINGGSIDFYRTINGREARLTRIRNIRYGTVSTNSSGSGVVNFDGFRQPMLVFPTVKSANFGKNMASIFCYAEHISGTQYRFYVGGTNEDFKEAKAIRVNSRNWNANSVVSTTFLGWTGSYASGGSFSMDRVKKHEFRGHDRNVTKVPVVRVRILRNGENIMQRDYTANARIDSSFNYSIGIDISGSVNIFKKFANRTNVNYTMAIDVIQPNLEVKCGRSYHKEYGSDGGSATFYYQKIGTILSLNANMFSNISLTASAETSTISSSTGYGEVGYIAMEID